VSRHFEGRRPLSGSKIGCVHWDRRALGSYFAPPTGSVFSGLSTLPAGTTIAGTRWIQRSGCAVVRTLPAAGAARREY